MNAPITSDGFLAGRVHLLAKGLLFVMPFALLGGYFYGSGKLFTRLNQEKEVAHNSGETDGSRLYARHCAQCHGLQGDGQGVASLNPPARYFGYDKYRFASTDNGIPTDDDLMHILKKGIEGASMPAFPQLRDEEHLAIINHVRQLARKGLYERLLKEAKAKEDDGGDEVNLTQIAANVDKRSQVGQPLKLPESFPDASSNSLSNGKRVFQTACASCHGPEGRGDGPQTKDPKFVNENGTKAYPRDLTAGIYKVGGEHQKLYARIMLGIPGTPMPASSNLPARDILDLVNYVRSLPANKANNMSGAE
jgi:mono/diheme cytochrome c family protein